MEDVGDDDATTDVEGTDEDGAAAVEARERDLRAREGRTVEEVEEAVGDLAERSLASRGCLGSAGPSRCEPSLPFITDRRRRMTVLLVDDEEVDKEEEEEEGTVFCSSRSLMLGFSRTLSLRRVPLLTAGETVADRELDADRVMGDAECEAPVSDDLRGSAEPNDAVAPDEASEDADKEPEREEDEETEERELARVWRAEAAEVVVAVAAEVMESRMRRRPMPRLREEERDGRPLLEVEEGGEGCDIEREDARMVTDGPRSVSRSRCAAECAETPAAVYDGCSTSMGDRCCVLLSRAAVRVQRLLCVS